MSTILRPPAAGRRFVIGLPFAWLTIAFLIPFLIVLRMSFAELDDSGSPFGPLLTFSDGVISIKAKIVNYVALTEDDNYLWTFLRSLAYAGVTMVLCLVTGYPFAWFMARAKPAHRPVLLMMVMLPFWTSFLLRIYAWKGILANQGLLNNLLMWLGVITEPLKMMNTPFALVLGMYYAYLPFMILPLYSNLVKMDVRFLEAAADLGATPWQAFWRVTVPLSKSGIIAGAMLVFIPGVGEFVIPELLGGPETLLIGRLMWDEFFVNTDWPRASALAVVAILLILVPMAVFNKYKAEQEEEGRA
ncbi:ABC transporter permease subunit [Massilia sp. DJPM01]|uniref:ABC transporter permease subunit n=1 Tax=Massilia sp. DJPM01 TaxID=3024404 RepID=UPI00259E3A0D|nr:ABC transporter permease subunit [Massilia sp. DJPM01]MDM5177223.1 ABC transporter permease subunit [Massilia sp. DJPM01]